MKNIGIIASIVIGIILLLAVSVTATIYFVKSSKEAHIVSIAPFMVKHKLAYQDCFNVTHKYYTHSGDKNNLIGGIAGGATGAVVGNALFASPVGIGVAAVAGTLAGQQIEKSVNKPKAHYSQQKQCITKYKHVYSQAGYLVTFDYNGAIGTRVLANSPTNTTIAIDTLNAAPTPEQIKAQIDIANSGMPDADE